MNQEELKAALKKWLYQEMQQHSLGAQSRPLNPDDFRPLCVGPNATVWRWVVSHVYSAQPSMHHEWRPSVRNIRGNLSLNNKTSGRNKYKVRYGDKGDNYDDNIGNLLKRRVELTGEITSTLRDVGILKHDIERLSTDITETEEAYQKQVESINNVKRKCLLNEAFAAQVAYTAAQYKEYEKSINNKVNLIKTQADKSLETEKFFSKESSSKTEDGEDDSCSLETASTRSVRQCCQSIGDFLHVMSQGTFHGDKQEFAKQKGPLWTKVGEVSTEYSPDQILTSLQLNVREAAARLKDMTSKVDIRRDAQKLRFKYEPASVLRDLSSTPSLLSSVHELLQERSREHFKRYIELQKNTNQRRNLEDKLTTVQNHIQRQLTSLSKKGVDVTVLRSLVEVEIELDGYRTSLHCLNSESDRLRTIVDNSLKHKQDLYTKHRRIQEFQNFTNKKQALIQVLVKQNINSQSRIESQVKEIEEYVDRSLRSHEQQICIMSDKLNNSVNIEVKEFANLTLPYLMFSHLDSALKTAVMDLSINQTTAYNIRPPLMTVLKCIRFPPFQGPEMILRKCLELKHEIEESLHRISWESTVWDQQYERCGNENITGTMKELCDKIREQDAKQLNNLLPLLQMKIAKTTKSISNCLHVKDVVSDWWEQPGQHCVPWLVVDGQTLQQYLDRWTVLATSLRQFIVT